MLEDQDYDCYETMSCRSCRVRINTGDVHSRCNVCLAPYCSNECAMRFYCSHCGRPTCTDCYPNCDDCMRRGPCHKCMKINGDTLCFECR